MGVEPTRSRLTTPTEFEVRPPHRERSPSGADQISTAAVRLEGMCGHEKIADIPKKEPPGRVRDPAAHRLVQVRGRLPAAHPVALSAQPQAAHIAGDRLEDRVEL